MLGGLTFLSSQAHADLVFVSNAGLTTGGTFAYDLNFSDNIDSGTGQPTQRLVNAANSTGGNTPSFATIYDVSGLNSAIVNPTYANLFTLTRQNIGVTPPGTAPTDDPALPNITLTYTGPTVTSDVSFSDILTMNSSFTTTNPNGQFTSTVTKNTGASAGSSIASIGFIAIPGTISAAAVTPEPGSMALLAGAGLSGSVFVLRRRRNRK